MAQRSGGKVPGLRRLMPGIEPLTGYRRAWLRGDLLAGVTVAAYLVPQVMAYAGVAGLPPVVGLWAILPGLVLYALLGSSRLLSVGPESTTALMTATAIGPLAGGDPGRYAVLAAALAITVGLLCVVAWAVRLGFVADLLSRPVLVGYLAGVALIMMVDQVPKLTGVETTGSGFFPQAWSFLWNLTEAHLATVVVAAAALVFLFLAPRFLRTVPGPLLALVLGTAAVAVLDLDERYGIKVIGEVPAGLPGFDLPGPGDLRGLVLPALGVLLVGYTDFILTARAFADRDDAGRPLDANQELLALGAANLGAGALHGFPVSSSASRTALAASAGARTQLYSLVACAGVLAVLLFLSPLLARTPSAVLGALVVYAAVRMIDLTGFRRLATFRRRELLLALGCLAGVLALDILYGVLVAVGLSVAELLTRVARPHDAVQGLVPGVPGMHDVEDYPEARTIPGLVVYRYDSPLFFANAEDFRRRALAAVDGEEGPVRWFVLNTEANVEVDITALDAVDALRRELTGRGVVFALARVKQDLRDELEAYGLAGSVGDDLIFPTLPTALAAYRVWCRTRDEAP
ncbi:SulP family inorganic anion transporter [Streptomyces fructofermentans]|uniref:Sodium-independent anion transporter n=1 Tax=Streptomyces fructofermentans TaxID=152141 RepID=A0A918ND99_9ACTN|nr:sulfate permease [Streptomyces fructofermentans]GGX59005.1 sodium-independent anion transporter [Streptomyces fructofermentans]